MPITIDPVAILNKLEALHSAAPNDARFVQAIEWVRSQIADDCGAAA